MKKKGKKKMSQPLTDQKVPAPSSFADCLNTKVTWFRTKDPIAFWHAKAGTETWTVRVNDFPEDTLYTLFVNDEELGRFNEWPHEWSRAEEVPNGGSAELGPAASTEIHARS
jgi:hypothetical protein